MISTKASFKQDPSVHTGKKGSMGEGRGEGLEGVHGGCGGAGEGRESHTLHVMKAEEINKEKHTYPKAADLHHFL